MFRGLASVSERVRAPVDKGLRMDKVQKVLRFVALMLLLIFAMSFAIRKAKMTNNISKQWLTIEFTMKDRCSVYAAEFALTNYTSFDVKGEIKELIDNLSNKTWWIFLFSKLSRR